ISWSSQPASAQIGPAWRSIAGSPPRQIADGRSLSCHAADVAVIGSPISVQTPTVSPTWVTRNSPPSAVATAAATIRTPVSHHEVSSSTPAGANGSGQNGRPPGRYWGFVIADKLDPLTGLALANVFYEAEDAQAVWSSIDKVTDLDDDHVVRQGERLVSRAHSGQ